MEQVKMGRSGLKVSQLGLGSMGFGSPKWMAWVMDEAESRPYFKRALDLGITYFDTADGYSHGAAEEVVGRALLEYAGRDNVVISTKVHATMSDRPNDGGLSRKHIMDAIDQSLRRLGVDYVDKYIIHRFDWETPIEETLEALHDVVKAGKARYLGASNLRPHQLVKMHQTQIRMGWTQWISYQPHYNLLYREDERDNIPYCIDEGLGVTPWSPVARGLLAGPYQPQSNVVRAKTDPLQKMYGPDDVPVIDRCVELAKQRGVSPAQIATAWTLHKPGVNATLIGPTEMFHIDEAVAALDIKFTDEELNFLEELYRPHPLLGLDPPVHPKRD